MEKATKAIYTNDDSRTVSCIPSIKIRREGKLGYCYIDAVIVSLTCLLDTFNHFLLKLLTELQKRFEDISSSTTSSILLSIAALSALRASSEAVLPFHISQGAISNSNIVCNRFCHKRRCLSSSEQNGQSIKKTRTGVFLVRPTIMRRHSLSLLFIGSANKIPPQNVKMPTITAVTIPVVRSSMFIISSLSSHALLSFWSR